VAGKRVTLKGRVKRGHGIASGASPDSPYPRGSLDMQIPLFRELGLNLSNMHPGTLNISIEPFTFTVNDPEFTFYGVEWTDEHPPENFSFSKCKLIHDNESYTGWIYYPHPETKMRDFQGPSIIEVVADYISGLECGDPIEIMLNTGEIQLVT